MNSTKLLQVNNLSKTFHTKKDEIKVIDNISFDMQMDFSNFFGDMFNDFEGSFISSLTNKQELLCDKCKNTYDDFIKNYGLRDCFQKCLQSVLTPVERDAFVSAENLSELVMNDGLEVIHDAVSGTDLRTLQLPESVTTSGSFWSTKF